MLMATYGSVSMKADYYATRRGASPGLAAPTGCLQDSSIISTLTKVIACGLPPFRMAQGELTIPTQNALHSSDIRWLMVCRVMSSTPSQKTTGGEFISERRVA